MWKSFENLSSETHFFPNFNFLKSDMSVKFRLSYTDQLSNISFAELI